MGRTDLDIEEITDEVRSRHGPAVARFHGDVYLAWVGDPNLLINVINLRTREKVTLQQTGIGGAGLAALGDRLYLAWTGTDPGRHLNMASSTDGKAFERQVVLPHTSIDRPALAALGGQLYLAWAGSEGEGHLNMLRTPDGQAFSVNTKLDDTSFAGPSLTVDETMRTVAIGWVGTDGVGHLNLKVTSAGVTFAIVTAPPNEASNFAPAIAWYDDRIGTPSQLYVAWTGQDNRGSLNHIHSVFVDTWEGKQTLGTGSIGGPALLASPGRVDAFWADNDGVGTIKQAILVGS